MIEYNEAVLPKIITALAVLAGISADPSRLAIQTDDDSHSTEQQPYSFINVIEESLEPLKEFVKGHVNPPTTNGAPTYFVFDSMRPSDDENNRVNLKEVIDPEYYNSVVLGIIDPIGTVKELQLAEQGLGLCNPMAVESFFAVIEGGYFNYPYSDKVGLYKSKGNFNPIFTRLWMSEVLAYLDSIGFTGVGGVLDSYYKLPTTDFKYLGLLGLPESAHASDAIFIGNLVQLIREYCDTADDLGDGDHAFTTSASLLDCEHIGFFDSIGVHLF